MAYDFEGGISRSVILTKIYNGVVSFAGSLSGVLSPSGVLYSTISFSGSLIRWIQISRILNSSLSLIGGIIRKIQITSSLAGNLTFSGTSIGIGPPEGTLKTVLGALGLNGWITRIDAYKSRLFDTDNTLSLSGIVSWLPRRFLSISPSSVLSFLGSVSRVLPSWTILQGSLARLINITKTKSGDLNLTGAISYLYYPPVGLYRTVTAIFNPSGLYRRLVERWKSLTASITLGGTYTYLISRVGLFYTASGVLSFVGNLSRAIQVSHVYFGVSNFAGAISKAINRLKTYAGQLGFSGNVVGWKFGVPNLWYRTVTGTLGLIGTLQSAWAYTRMSGNLAMVGQCRYQKYGEILYYGVKNP